MVCESVTYMSYHSSMKINICVYESDRKMLNFVGGQEIESRGRGFEAW